VIDSYQTARRKQLGQPVEEGLGVHSLRMDAPVSAIVLIALGALFLLDNFGIHLFRDLGRFWPVLLIVVGVVLIQRRMAGRTPETPNSRAKSDSGPGPGAL
ncbi:MAG: LiaI-LiaF-like domain-containing protein, partial [Terriglobia bacterium]